MKSLLLLLIMATLFSGCVDQTADSSALSQGHETGNGTDNVPFQGAWVAGENSEIKYCLQMGKDFGVSRVEALTQIEAAFQKWKDYVMTKKINEALEKFVMDGFVRSTYPPREPSADEIARAKLFHVPVKSQLLASCDGTQNISFQLGFMDSTTKRMWKKYVNPTAFADLAVEKTETGKGRGIIWLAKEGSLADGKDGYPMWELKNRLLGVLIHEIGHAYGVGHIEQTIMEKDMWGLMLASYHTSVPQEEIELMLENIDHSNELYTNVSDLNRKYEGDLGFTFSDQQIEDGKESFLLFTGKNPVGKLSASFMNNVLVLSDEEESFSFPVTVISTHYTPKSGGGVFNVSRSWKLPAGQTSGLVGSSSSLYQTAMVQIGEIETLSGEKLPVELEINQGRPFYMSYIQERETHGLLVMKGPRY